MTTAPARVETRTREETESLGERIGRAARGGDVIALWGELGAGKTTLVRGIARGLGIPDRDVTSPTFVIVHEHEAGRAALFHVDLYRLAPEDAGSIGWEESLSAGGVVAIEWPDRVEAALPEDRLDVRIAYGSGDLRRFSFEPTGARSAELARAAR